MGRVEITGKINLASGEQSDLSGPVNAAIGVAPGAFSGSTSVARGTHNTPAHSGPLSVLGVGSDFRPLYAVDPKNSMLLAFNGSAWGPVCQLDPEAARAWELGYSVTYHLAPHMGALLILWCNGKLQELVAARYDSSGLTIVSRQRGMDDGGPSGQITLGELFNSGGRTYGIGTCAERYIVEVACGGDFTLARRSDDTLVAWGSNEHGKCEVPRDLEDVTLFSAGRDHGVAQTNSSEIVAWGRYTTPESDESPYSTPITEVPAGLVGVTRLSAGGNFTLAVKPDSTVVAWGDMHLLFERGTVDRDIMLGLTSVVEISAGFGHALARQSNNTVVVWGSDSDGQRSDIPAGLTALSISAGMLHSLAARTDGTVAAWGNNNWGQCDVPAGLTDVVTVYAGARHSVAVRSNGEIVAWGHPVQATLPTDLADPLSLCAGDNHNAWARQDSSVGAWGSNALRQATPPDHRDYMFSVSVDQDWAVSVRRTKVLSDAPEHRYTAKDQPGCTAALALQVRGHAHHAITNSSGYGQDPVFVEPGLTCRQLKHPELLAEAAIDFGYWWLNHGFNPATGAWTANLNREGVSTNQQRALIPQSRNVYALCKAFLLTGDLSLLPAAKKGLEYQDATFWDPVVGGWFATTNTAGTAVNVTGVRYTLYEHFGVLSALALYEVTRDPYALFVYDRAQDIKTTYQWDDRPGLEGYYRWWYTDTRPPENKDSASTIDGIAADHLGGYLLFESPYQEGRFRTLADAVSDWMVSTIGSPENLFGMTMFFTADWEPTAPEFVQNIGIFLKAAWVIARAGMIFRDTKFLVDARRIVDAVVEHDKFGPNSAWDHVNGGPVTDVSRTTGLRTNSDKEWWMVEQGFTALITLWHITGDRKYLRYADRSLKFFFDQMVDPIYGEVYPTVGLNGLPKVRTFKGDRWKGGYHSVELAYLGYLYASFYLYGRDVPLHYYFEPTGADRAIKLNLVEILAETGLLIRSVTLDGANYTNFESEERILHIPAGTGGLFQVTYGVVRRYGRGHHEDLRSYLSAPLSKTPSMREMAVPGHFKKGGLRFYEWAKNTDRHNPWQRMMIASTTFRGHLVHFAMDGIVYQVDEVYGIHRQLIDVEAVLGNFLSPSVTLTQLVNPEAGDPYAGGSIVVDEAALRTGLGRWVGAARVTVLSTPIPSAHYPPGKAGRITWDRGNGVLEAFDMNWEDTFSRDASGVLGPAIGWDGERYPSVPIPLGAVLLFQAGLFGPFDSRDAHCRLPVCGYGFEAHDMLWFVYLSGTTDADAIRSPAFVVGLSFDEDMNNTGGVYIKLELGGKPINVNGAACEYDSKAQTLDITYLDPAVDEVKHVRVLVTPTMLIPLSYSSVFTADPTDNRSFMAPGGIITYDTRQASALITGVEYKRETTTNVVSVVLSAPFPGPRSYPAVVEFAAEDTASFRPATAVHEIRWQAGEGGHQNFFEHDLTADGVVPWRDKIQYRVVFDDAPETAPVAIDPLVDLYVQGLVYGCGLGIDAININGTPVAMLFGADDPAYYNPVQYRRTDGAVKVASSLLSDIGSFQLEVCHNTPALSDGTDGAVMWVVPHGAPPTAVLCEAAAAPGEIVEFGACTIFGGGSAPVVIGSSACAPEICVEVPPPPETICVTNFVYAAHCYSHGGSDCTLELLTSGTTCTHQSEFIPFGGAKPLNEWYSTDPDDDGCVVLGHASTLEMCLDETTCTPVGEDVFTNSKPDIALTCLCCMTSEGLIQVTGQTVSYLSGDDGEVQAGASWPSPRFVDHGDGTVTDLTTGLMWTQDSTAVPAAPWTTVLTNTAALTTGGHTDWRVPNLNELLSLVDYGLGDPVTSGPFTNLASGSWRRTSTTRLTNTPDAYSVVINGGSTTGTVTTNAKSQSHPVWAVRGTHGSGVIDVPRTGQITSYAAGDDGALQAGAPWPIPRFVDNGDDTVTDTLTQLMWAKDSRLGVTTMTWADAIAWANALTLAGHTDWRIPNIRELQSLINPGAGTGQYSYTLMAAGHPFVLPSYFGAHWSSTTHQALQANAMTSSFYNTFGAITAVKTSLQWAWPVRGPVPPTPPPAADCNSLYGPHWTSSVTLTGCGGPGACSDICAGSISYSTESGTEGPPPADCYVLWNIDAPDFTWSGYFFLWFDGSEWSAQIGIYGGPEWWAYNVSVEVSGDGRYVISPTVMAETTAFGCNNITLEIT